MSANFGLKVEYLIVIETHFITNSSEETDLELAVLY